MARVIDLDSLPEAQFLRRFGPPEFVAVDVRRPPLLAIVDDREGRPWAFVDMAALRPDFLFYAGRAARVRQVGDTLEIAIRAEFADRDPAHWRIDPTDLRVLRKRDWDAANPGLLPDRLRQARHCNLAVELPLRAERIRLVER